VQKDFLGEKTPMWYIAKIILKTRLLTPEQCFYSILFGKISHTAVPKEKSSAKDFFGGKNQSSHILRKKNSEVSPYLDNTFAEVAKIWCASIAACFSRISRKADDDEKETEDNCIESIMCHGAWRNRDQIMG
jgi:hypothetical protein